ncbi:hypothetical protein HOP50_04g28240 [Chloropicon primus]|uniref:Uncharacterized protein n=1 Tax=Chloropicon primus TaxID=1764295 RepID=A0A5B8MIJ5_9CHLO|nr:hypothetical protein A3770_04p28240 [Chloropicon primus]UPQ99516.1 hypothetical protein HOP50_04g28240 [Chloropicon primus]|eukprot:QDZ20306.1 hypothetical protein A3770_04p28240 [Chloropicon primus]
MVEENVVVIGDVFSQSWVAGVRGGGSGTNVHVTLAKDVDESVSMERCCYRGKWAKLQEKRKQRLFVAYFQGEANREEERHVLLADGGGPQPPGRSVVEKEEDAPELKEDEALITFLVHGKLRELKVDKVRSERMIPYPECPPPRNECRGPQC